VLLALRGRPGLLSWWAIIGVAGIAGLVLYGWMLWKLPDRMHLHGAQDRYNARLLVISAGGAFAVVAGLLYTARSYRLSRRGQITDRFTNALQQLDSGQLYVRVGGVQALGRLMQDSPVHHDDITEVLAAFIRDRVPTAVRPATSGTAPPEPPGAPARQPPSDVQAALTALGRRPKRPERRSVSLVAASLACADLSRANLAGADLTGADLARANLRNADLSHAILERASLAGADLTDSDLTRADLYVADLSGASLQRADLTFAYVRSADLTRANLAGADLTGANLAVTIMSGAHLSGATLVRSYLSMAKLNDADLTRANLRDVRGLRGEQLLASRTGEFRDLTGRFDRPRWSRTPGPRDQAADG
jgi:uncharacterized protein YjbI with pentapeptide repeats